MPRWDKRTAADVENPQIDAFLDEIVAVMRKHGMCLGHEDHHGAFLVHRGISEDNIKWLNDAMIAENEFARTDH